MYKKLSFILLVLYFLVSMPITGQTTSSEVLKLIAKNNTSLQALLQKNEADQWQLGLQNKLPDLELSAYYLPNGVNDGVPYKELEVSQSFEFPTIYVQRNKLIQQQGGLQQNKYLTARQDILEQAMALMIEYDYLQKFKAHESEIVENARILTKQIQTAYDKGEVGIIALKKSKLVWLQEQYKIRDIDQKLNQTQVLLVELNGGKPIELQDISIDWSVKIPEKQLLWKERLKIMPELLSINLTQELAQQNLRLNKQSFLPTFKLGYSYQGNHLSSFSGVMAGLSLPLWGAKNKIKSAKYNLEASQIAQKESLRHAYAHFEKDYQTYELLQQQFDTYLDNMENLEGENLLKKAYDLGELSFLQYVNELQFFHTTYDQMIALEKDLAIAKLKLLKHQL